MVSKYLLLGAYTLLGIGILTASTPAGAAMAAASGDAAPTLRLQGDVDPTEDDEDTESDEDDEEDGSSDEDEEGLA